MTRQSFLILTTVLCLLQISTFASQPAPPVVSEVLLNSAGLDLIWHNKLPLKESEKIQRGFLRADAVYLLSDRNYLFCLETRTGQMRFAQQLASPGLPVYDPQLFGDKLLIAAANTVFEMDPQTGAIKKLLSPSYSLTCPPVRNDRFIYLAGTDRRLHCVEADSLLREFDAASTENAVITSVRATEETVFSATAGGNVVAMTPDKPQRKWQFSVPEPITAPVLLDGDWLYVACEDYNLYKLDAATGQRAWVFRSGASLIDAPTVTTEYLYLPAREEGLYAIDKDTGKLLWQLTDGLSLLAESAGKAYVITDKPTLAVMDNRAGKQLYSVNFAAVNRYVTNATGDNMYIADSGGRVACIKPAE